MSAQQAATSAAALRDQPHLRAGRRKKVPDEVVLAVLGEVLARHGKLSKELISVTPGIPHSHALTRRFGGLAGLYARLGYAPSERQALGMRVGGTRTNSLNATGGTPTPVRPMSRPAAAQEQAPRLPD